ncbi:hypothetical protein MK904_04520 [Loigolactobacillus coryniformis]|nr:hypothetical protein [Loigolactobacillus coryniformis]MDT3392815.1 hypothetical protein [Bacillota bacterium]OEH90650.1 hypothetical protein ATO00_02815 [Loigolactobacillus coryniformis subsp. coryniformis]RRG05431.1 MAG: hypothetical protein DUD28_06080 [Lactobacillus sp.]ATO55825.1 hypothetical protein LC20001_09380 [Loigolactobacillus coryniformis subsp. coryniformis KCTC 3167 = DSM 20001]MBW4802837.1 hypothetical protein [Loigolactobacillus coryniformis subsp. torquens]
MTVPVKSLIKFQEAITTRALPQNKQVVADLLQLALIKYQAGQMTLAYLEYSLFPQLLPLLQADQVAAVKRVFQQYGQSE